MAYNRLHDQIKAEQWQHHHVSAGADDVDVFRKHGKDGHEIHVKGQNWKHLNKGEVVAEGTGHQSVFEHLRGSQHSEEQPDPTEQSRAALIRHGEVVLAPPIPLRDDVEQYAEGQPISLKSEGYSHYRSPTSSVMEFRKGKERKWFQVVGSRISQTKPPHTHTHGTHLLNEVPPPYERLRND